MFERSEAPFPRLWARGPAPSTTGSRGSSNATGSVLMFFVCLLFLTVGFCYLA